MSLYYLHSYFITVESIKNPTFSLIIISFVRQVVLSVENDKKKPKNSEKQRKKTPATTPSAAKKGPHSVLASSGEYEVSRNLNGSFKETKSSDKTNKPFVTPVRLTKRIREG